MRKTKGSHNYQKARLKVARIHAKIKDSRLDYTHKLTTQLIKRYQTIVVEDLAIKNMVKNHKLARAISDANWGELVRQLEYKAEWYGREVVKIDRYFPSSKRCSNCGHIVEKLPLSVREWDCPECGTNHDRDINASINILRMGTRVGVRRNVRPRAADRRKRSDAATTPVARECRPREGMLTKRGNAHTRRLREEQCQSVERL